MSAEKESARRVITKLSLDLVQIVNQRSQAALIVGAAKAENGVTQIRDWRREEEVISRVIEANNGPLSDEAVARIVQTIMNEASKLQSEMYKLPLGIPLDEGPGFTAPQ